MGLRLMVSSIDTKKIKHRITPVVQAVAFEALCQLIGAACIFFSGILTSVSTYLLKLAAYGSLKNNLFHDTHEFKSKFNYIIIFGSSPKMLLPPMSKSMMPGTESFKTHLFGHAHIALL